MSPSRLGVTGVRSRPFLLHQKNERCAASPAQAYAIRTPNGTGCGKCSSGPLGSVRRRASERPHRAAPVG